MGFFKRLFGKNDHVENKDVTGDYRIIIKECILDHPGKDKICGIPTMDYWAHSSARIRKALSIAANTGNESLLQINRNLFDEASVPEKRFMLFIILSRVAVIMRQATSSKDGKMALLQAANIFDGVPIYDDLAASFRKLSSDPNQSDTWIDFCHGSATEFRNQALDFLPRSDSAVAEIHFGLFINHLDKGELEKAKEEIEKASQISFSYSLDFCRLAEAYEGKGQVKIAISTYEEFLNYVNVWKPGGPFDKVVSGINDKLKELKLRKEDNQKEYYCRTCNIVFESDSEHSRLSPHCYGSLSRRKQARCPVCFETIYLSSDSPYPEIEVYCSKCNYKFKSKNTSY